MGADGGVAWLRVTGSKERVIDALRPFGVFDLRGSSVNEEARDTCRDLRETSDRIVGIYGDDCGDRPALYDVRQVIEEMREVLADPAKGLGPLVTWGDVVNAHTAGFVDSEAPDPWRLFALNRWIAYLVEERECAHASAVESVGVLEWIATIVSNVACDSRPHGSAPLPSVDEVETYT